MIIFFSLKKGVPLRPLQKMQQEMVRTNTYILGGNSKWTC